MIELKIVSIFKGMFVGFIAAFAVPILMLLGIGMIYGGNYNLTDHPWKYIACLIAMIPIAGFLGYYLSNHQTLSQIDRWQIAAIAVLLITMIANSIGLIIGFKLILGSFEIVNIWPLLLYALMRGIIFLPLSIPFGKLVLDILYHWVHNIPF